jgi:hypothetical protein
LSFVLTPILVDLDEVRKAIGCKDESLVEAIVGRLPRDSGGGEADDAGGVGLGEAIRRLILGEEPDQEQALQYVRAFERICAHLGEVILPDAWGGVSWAAFSDTELEAVLDGGPPVDLPLPVPGPCVGYLTAEAIADRVDGLGDDHLESDDPDLQELLEEYEGWLRQAASKGKSIVFFV